MADTELTFSKISDTRYESNDGKWSVVSDFNDDAAWHLLNKNGVMVAAVKGDAEEACNTAILWHN